MRWLLAATASLLLVLPAAAYRGEPVSEPGVIGGRVAIGADLQVDRGRMSYPSPELFGHPREIERELRVDGQGGVANVIVTVTGVERGLPATAGEIELLNEGGEFTPRVQVATKRSQLTIRNLDEVLHNVHGFQHLRNLFNFALPTTESVVRERLSRTGLISLRCDISHPWMTAFIFVSPHPYAAVSDAAGHFEIKGLPPGSYTLDLWHERLGELQIPVVVAHGATTRVEPTYHPDNRLKAPSDWLLYGR